MLLGASIFRPWVQVAYSLSLVLVVLATFEAARREPKAGNTWLAVGMFAIPTVMIASTVLSATSFMYATT